MTLRSVHDAPDRSRRHDEFVRHGATGEGETAAARSGRPGSGLKWSRHETGR
jgi:hypothetical protein